MIIDANLDGAKMLTGSVDHYRNTGAASSAYQQASAIANRSPGNAGFFARSPPARDGCRRNMGHCNRFPIIGTV
jgi:hypothetical protein